MASIGPAGVVVSLSASFASEEVVTVSKITGEILILRPVEVVFDVVVDERNEPLYNPALLSSDKVTDGAAGL